MVININGNINRYYVQTLCMIFFPGASFSESAVDDGTPSLTVDVFEEEGVCRAVASARLGDAFFCEEKAVEYSAERTAERTVKIAVGAAVIAALGGIMSYRPAWGIMVGVRPSKVAMEYLNAGMKKTRVKELLVNDYLVIPKKASLATKVAASERKIIGTPDQKDCSVYLATSK